MYMFVQEPATEGTVKAHAHFNAETDVKALRTAMKGFGQSVLDVYEVLCMCNDVI